MPDFDVLLELSPAKLPRAHLSWLPLTGGGGGAAGASGGGTAARQPKPPSAYANLRQHGEIAHGIGSDPASELLERLREAYGSLALFFLDAHGGTHPSGRRCTRAHGR